MATVKRLYRSVNVVPAGRVVFKFNGSDYRLVTAMDLAKRIV
jgi:mRNA-degrading endonuclease HigB of HigAB toxin-antitoxin module